MSRAVDYLGIARRTPRAEFVALNAHYFLAGRRQMVAARPRSTGVFAQLSADPAETHVDEVVMSEDRTEPLGLVLVLLPRHPAPRASGAPAPAALRVTVGRTEASDLVLPDPLISRHHALFRVFADRVELADTGSANGTFVGGEQLAPKGAPRAVASGDVVRFSNLEFELLDAGALWDRVRAVAGGG